MCGAAKGVSVSVREDTVSTDEEDDEVKAHDHSRGGRPSVRHDAIVHNHIPVFSGQDLNGSQHVSVLSQTAAVRAKIHSSERRRAL